MSINKATLAIALAAVVGSATLASADVSYFGLTKTLPETSTIDLGTVRAADAGTVEIYDYRLGTQGALLGTETVNAGANSNVRIDLGLAPAGDVLAVLKVDGQVVATQRYDVANNAM